MVQRILDVDVPDVVREEARLVDLLEEAVLAIVPVEAHRKPVLEPRIRVVVRRDAGRETLGGHLAVVLVAELRHVAAVARQVAAARAARLAAVRVAQHAVRRVVRERQALLRQRVAHVDGEVQLLRRHETEDRGR